jgi:hypothetical protein
MCFRRVNSSCSKSGTRVLLPGWQVINHGQATGKLYHLRMRVECTLFVIYKAGREPENGNMELDGVEREWEGRKTVIKGWSEERGNKEEE